MDFDFNLLCRLHVYVYIKTARGKCLYRAVCSIFSACARLFPPCFFDYDCRCNQQLVNYIQGTNMTVIRLTRMGRKKQPFYRIVVTDSRKPRDGGWIEKIGHYNPMVSPAVINFDEERLNYWIGTGAQMSDRVKKITGK